MFGACSVVMASASGPCSVEVAPRPQSAAVSETEREQGMPLLPHSGNGPVQTLSSGMVDAERVESRAGGSGITAGGREFEALATAPVELTAVLPASYQQGSLVLMHGPHGPVEVIPPLGVEPGMKVCYRLAPPPDFKIEVPPGASPGTLVQFERADGIEVSVPVPPGLRPGDSFEVTPPALMVKVPEGAEAGDLVIFRNSVAAGPGGREETEWCRARIPEGTGAGGYFGARLPAPPGAGPPSRGGLSFLAQGVEKALKAQAMPLSGGSCTFTRRADDVEEV